ncbi:ABC transporter permease family protein [Massiliimalia massiliensis]|uniref:ABC transporter permease n=1 Tax=Massiliimalia massiliensis TaxID=1852384 RepID=UPI0009878105|nr:ABC transporter permease [Massiliimalia massiliensis]MBS1473723.1 ABC transporter permease subunit [Massiliimalia sp.]
MKEAMRAIIKKDLKGITANKRLFSTLLIVPLVLTIVMPTIFILVIHFVPEETDDFQQLLKMLPMAKQTGDFSLTVIGLILNYILPVFFLMIPIMTASIMAASSFVGEKEKHTLETLLYCPLTLKQIFRSKVFASFLLSMIVSFFSFFTMLIVLEAEILFFTGNLVLPDVNWLVIMLLISPAISLIAITLIVRGSAKAQSVEESQQGAVFLILPIILLVVGQFTGILLISFWILLGLGIVCALLAWLLLKKSMGRFTYEMLLR